MKSSMKPAIEKLAVNYKLGINRALDHLGSLLFVAAWAGWVDGRDIGRVYDFWMGSSAAEVPPNYRQTVMARINKAVADGRAMRTGAEGVLSEGVDNAWVPKSGDVAVVAVTGPAEPGKKSGRQRSRLGGRRRHATVRKRARPPQGD